MVITTFPANSEIEAIKLYFLHKYNLIGEKIKLKSHIIAINKIS